MTVALRLLALIGLLAAAAVPAAGQDIRSERVRFAPGASSAVVEGRIAGREIVDYILRAQAGQAMNVSMAGDNPSGYFNILAPGETEAAIFVGSNAGNQYEGVLRATGDYRIRVYLMRNAARRGESLRYRLEMIVAAAGGGSATGAGGRVPASPEQGGPRHWQVTGVATGLNLRAAASTSARTVARLAPGEVLTNLGCRRAEGRVWCDVQPFRGGPRGFAAAEYLRPAVGPDGGVARGDNDSALRAGQGRFDATGMVPCARFRGQPAGQCRFGVARAGGGDATVVVTHPDGFSRALYFVRGELVGADTSQADGYPPVSGARAGDLTRARVGEERYQIPDAAIFGG